MSSGALVFFDTDNEQDVVEYGNGHGMGPAIWDRMAKKRGFDMWMMRLTLNDTVEVFNGMGPGGEKDLFAITLWEPTLVAREHWPQVVEDILHLFGVWQNDGPDVEGEAIDIPSAIERLQQCIAEDKYVNHWGRIAAELWARKDDESLIAFGIYNTSVNEWPFDGPFDEETEEYAPFDPINMSIWYVPRVGRIRHPDAQEVVDAG